MHKYDVDGELQPGLDVPRIVLTFMTMFGWFLFGYRLGVIDWSEIVSVTASVFAGIAILGAVSVLVLFSRVATDDYFWRRG